MTIKKGEKVRIKDGSYMATQLIDGSISHSSPNINIIGWNRDVWTIILTNVGLPTFYDGDFLCSQNNVMIKNDINGEYWFCSRINIEKV